MKDWLSPLNMEEIRTKCRELNITLSSAACRNRLKLVDYLRCLEVDKKTELELLRERKLSRNDMDKRKQTETAVGGGSTEAKLGNERYPTPSATHNTANMMLTPMNKRKRTESSVGGSGTKKTKLGDERYPTPSATPNTAEVVSVPLFMQLPSAKEIRDHRIEFLDALSSDAVAEVNPHPAHVLIDGMLLDPEGILDDTGSEGTHAYLCSECLQHLSSNKLPPFTLSNKMWIGPVPEVLSRLTVPEQLLIAPVYPRCFIYKLHPKAGSTGDPTHEQSGLRWNVTRFPMNTDDVIEMLKGAKMPWPASILASVLAITYVGVGQLPANWLKSTFRVRRRVVLEALTWLVQNNKLFSDYVIDEQILGSLPEDDVPVEIIASIRQETAADILGREHDSYVPGPYTSDDENDMDEGVNETQHDNGDVVSIQQLGSMETDISTTSASELLMYGLLNLGQEPGYAV
ncbi:uncharacterized protein EI90DRAFT_3018962 [Cantharellus anzutake]|uniref:uncharacterized protein n=1 Tax=Cantharellus anzutake TaxID=1750568 RepID=UPI001903A954|nr:uncharacterized protein EI90DRAFT_3018962 [Cantharellus anzutake]KAF8325619.1 hypothetical protein EI90DRAFT_3018962 [Cantharellus anzutake]